MIGYLGIDCGMAGYLACLWEDGGVETFETPVRDGEYYIGAIWGSLAGLKRRGHIALAVVEQQQPYPDQSGPSNFTTGEGYMLWRALLTAAGIPFETISPQRWKADMGIVAPRVPAVMGTAEARHVKQTATAIRQRMKGLNGAYLPSPPEIAILEQAKAINGRRAEQKSAAKALAVAAAQRLFPGVDLRRTPKCRVPSDGMAEALLLAELARRRHTGRSSRGPGAVADPRAGARLTNAGAPSCGDSGSNGAE